MKSIVLGIVIGVLLLGCRGKDGAPGPAGKDGGLLTGDLSGHISLYDEFGKTISGVNGIKIEIEGSDPLITYIPTDHNFTISGIQSGTYRLKFSKQGFGTYYSNIFQFIGGNIIYTESSFNQRIFQMPTAKIISFDLAAIDSSYTYYTMTVTGKLDKTITAETPREMIIFAGDTSNVSSNNYSIYIRYNAILLSVDGSFSSVLFADKNRFKDKHIYAVAYLNAAGSNYYLDPNTNHVINNSLGEPSNILFIK